MQAVRVIRVGERVGSRTGMRVGEREFRHGKESEYGTMILEGLLTTVDRAGQVNLAPMGPVVDESLGRFVLRPFQSSTTFANLQATGEAVFHVTDDVLLLAQTAIGRLEQIPPLERLSEIDGWALSGACRWYALRVERIDVTQPRAEIETRVVAQRSQRDFFGFNRAKHAVLEAAILATRVHLIEPELLQQSLAMLKPSVHKTGGASELAAWAMLRDYIAECQAESADTFSA